MNEYYNSISPGYHELHGYEQEEKMNIIQNNLDDELASSNHQNSLLIDIGCGIGISTTHLPVTCVGIDPSLDSLKSANLERYRQFKKNRQIVNQDKSTRIDHLGYVCGIAEALPFKSDCCNISLSITAVHNFNNIETGLKEINRITRQQVVITVLKKARRYVDIIALIKKYFRINKMVESDIDDIYFLIPK